MTCTALGCFDVVALCAGFVMLNTGLAGPRSISKAIRIRGRPRHRGMWKPAITMGGRRRRVGGHGRRSLIGVEPDRITIQCGTENMRRPRNADSGMMPSEPWRRPATDISPVLPTTLMQAVSSLFQTTATSPSSGRPGGRSGTEDQGEEASQPFDEYFGV
jgi:hypothetical protein